MTIALAIAFGLLVAAPFIGRWRANVWLRANIAVEEPATPVGASTEVLDTV